MDRPEPTGGSRTALAWSGGKDSALALMKLRERGTEPVALLTTVAESFDRISIHGVRRELLIAQARALGIALVEIRIPSPCPNEVYEAKMDEALVSPPLESVDTVAFGDLFLSEVRDYREQQLARDRPPRRGSFPLWGRDTGELAGEFVAVGFEAILVTVDPRALDASFAGRRYDAELLEDLPAEVDPCGENGEFHTFVHAGPIFESPIAVQTGEVVERDGFVYCDLQAVPAPTGSGPSPPLQPGGA